jgi:hypothetical protein
VDAETVTKDDKNDNADDKDIMIGDPLELPMTFLRYASDMDALLSDVKKIWERSANDKGTSAYAALYTKFSIDMALILTEEVFRDLDIDNFQSLYDVYMEMLTNFEDLLDYQGAAKPSSRLLWIRQTPS